MQRWTRSKWPASSLPARCPSVNLQRGITVQSRVTQRPHGQHILCFAFVFCEKGLPLRNPSLLSLKGAEGLKAAGYECLLTLVSQWLRLSSSVGRLCLGSSSCLQDRSCQCSLATLQTLTAETWSFLHVLIPSNMEASFTYLGTSFTYLGTISSLLHSSFFSYFGQHPPTSFQIV